MAQEFKKGTGRERGVGCAWVLPGAKEASRTDVDVRGSEGQMAPRLESLGETLLQHLSLRLRKP